MVKLCRYLPSGHIRIPAEEGRLQITKAQTKTVQEDASSVDAVYQGTALSRAKTMVEENNGFKAPIDAGVSSRHG